MRSAPGVRPARGAVQQLDYLPAYLRDSAVDGVLSLALFEHLGVGFLFSATSYSTVGYGDVGAPTGVAAPRAG